MILVAGSAKAAKAVKYKSAKPPPMIARPKPSSLSFILMPNPMVPSDTRPSVITRSQAGVCWLT